MREAREDQTPWHGIFFKVERTLYRGRSPYQKIELVRNKAFGRVLLLDGLVQFLMKMFRHADFYLCPVPTYPGGTWCFLYLSDDVAPLGPKRKKPVPGLRYYNPDVHEAAFALPNFLRTAIGLDPKR